MKKGTILLNTYAGADNPLRVSLFIGRQSRGEKRTVTTLYVHDGKLKKATFEASSLLQTLIPVGYTDVLNRFTEEIENILNQPYEARTVKDDAE